jgi:hypothetical protein
MKLRIRAAIGVKGSLGIKDKVIRVLLEQYRDWKIRYPNEGIDGKWVEAACTPNAPQLSEEGWGPLGFLEACEREGRVCNSFGKALPLAAQVHGCYYNALAYIRKYGEKQKDLRLGYGFWISKEDFEREMLPDITKHAFCLLGDKIIDPTIRDMDSGDFVYWKEVPAEVWGKFNHKDGDSNYDARDFFAWIQEDLKSYSFNFGKELRDLWESQEAR